jgi:hypothetical protein
MTNHQEIHAADNNSKEGRGEKEKVNSHQFTTLFEGEQKIIKNFLAGHGMTPAADKQFDSVAFASIPFGWRLFHLTVWNTR